MELDADGREHVLSRRGVGVADGGVAGLDGPAVALLLERQLVGERAVGLLPAVGEQRASRFRGCAAAASGRRPGYPHSRSDADRSGVSAPRR